MYTSKSVGRATNIRPTWSTRPVHGVNDGIPLIDDDYTTKVIFDYILPIAPIAHTETLSIITIGRNHAYLLTVSRLATKKKNAARDFSDFRFAAHDYFGFFHHQTTTTTTIIALGTSLRFSSFFELPVASLWSKQVNEKIRPRGRELICMSKRDDKKAVAGWSYTWHYFLL